MTDARKKINTATFVFLVTATLAGCMSTADYDGCHGAGCEVDDPDDPNNWPLCSDGAQHPDCSYAPEGY